VERFESESRENLATMMRNGTSRRATAAWWLVLGLVSAEAPAGVVVTRKVVADVFSPPTAVTGSESCPQGLARPKSGDRVRLLVEGPSARIDEPANSVIVRLDAGKAYVLHHASKTYSELAYPPKASEIGARFRASMGPAADEVFPFVPEGPIVEVSERIGDLEVLHRSRTIASPMLGRRDVEVRLATDPQAAASASAVESLRQAIRDDGEPWLPLLGAEQGIPLGLGEVLHLPEALVRYTEQYLGSTREEIAADRFAPPGDYRRIDHAPDCF
jgi:hypothetical protein